MQITNNYNKLTSNVTIFLNIKDIIYLKIVTFALFFNEKGLLCIILNNYFSKNPVTRDVKGEYIHE